MAVLLLGASVALLLAAPTSAAPGEGDEGAIWPAEIGEEDLLDLVRRHSPRIEAERTRIARARASSLEAWQLPNPTVGYSGYGTVAGQDSINGSQHMLTVTQPLPNPLRLLARYDVAAREVDTATAEVDAVTIEELSAAREHFWSALVVQERIQLIEEAAMLIEATAAAVDKRRELGQASRFDVLRLTAEAAQLRAQLGALEAERQMNAGALGALVGRPGWRPRVRGELHGKPPLDATVASLDLALTETPTLRAAALLESQARRAVDVEFWRAWPTPVITLGSFGTTHGVGVALGVGVELDLPVFDRNQADLARARADLQAATLTRRALTTGREAELAARIAQVRSQTEAIARFEREVLEPLPELRRMAELSYQSGQASLVELLDALRTAVDVRLAYLELIEARGQSEVELYRLTATAAGAAPSGISSATGDALR